MEYYHYFHDSFIEDIIQDEKNSLVELIINVWWVGNSNNEHKKRLRLLFKETNYFVENNPYCINHIDDSSITIVNKGNEEDIHFAIKSEDPDEEPIIYIIAKGIEYEEIN